MTPNGKPQADALPSSHRSLGVAGGLSLVPLLAGWSAAPFHWVTVLQVLTGIEEFVIVALVPAHVGEMPTAWHAWRLRRGHPVRSTVAKGIADPAAQQTGRPARPGGL